MTSNDYALYLECSQIGSIPWGLFPNVSEDTCVKLVDALAKRIRAVPIPVSKGMAAHEFNLPRMLIDFKNLNKSLNVVNNFLFFGVYAITLFPAETCTMEAPLPNFIAFPISVELRLKTGALLYRCDITT